MDFVGRLRHRPEIRKRSTYSTRRPRKDDQTILDDLGWSCCQHLPTMKRKSLKAAGYPATISFGKKIGKSSEIFWNPTHLETSNSTLGTGAFGQPTLLRNLRRWGLGVDFGVAVLGSSALSKSGPKQGPGIGKRRSKATILSVDENHGHWPRDLERI